MGFFEEEKIVDFYKTDKFRQLGPFEYSMKYLVEIFYIQLVDYMYDLMGKYFFGQHFGSFLYIVAV